MKNLIYVLMFAFLISPKVWGNESNFTVKSYHIVDLYSTEKLSFGVNLLSVENAWNNCYTGTYKRNSIGIMARNFNGLCDPITFEEDRNMFVGIEISKKDSKNQFTVSLEGGFNFGIQNEKREDGTQKIRVHANVKGLYDWGFIKGQYKGVFRFVSPGTTPYSSNINDSFSNNYHIMFGDIKREGLILNKDIYVGIELTF